MLLDSASLYFRAFFAYRDHEALTAPDGTVVNALRGMVEFIATLAGKHEPDAIVACWDDAWRPQWRVDLIGSYKTQRAEADGAEIDTTEGLLGPQVPLIAEVLGLLGIPVVGAPDCEADDVIGTLSSQADGPVDIVTGDRDLFQLVDDERAVRVLYPAIGGIRDAQVVTGEWMVGKYGVRPDQYVDYSVMRGDASDGLPGVAGIGEKTAANLLAEFGDLDGILAAAADPGSSLKPRVRASLLESTDYIAAAREVVAVRREALPASTYVLTPVDEAAFGAFAERWGLGGAAERVLKALGGN